MPLLFFLGRSFASRLPHHSPHPTANTAYRLVAARVWKSPWLVTLLEAYGGRLAIEATVEPPVTVSRNQGSKTLDEREKGAGVWDHEASAESRADFCSPVARPQRLPTRHGCYVEGGVGFYRSDGHAERSTPDIDRTEEKRIRR